ncbi:hypothetical protein RGQ29_009777 [Quercus rubra]|uniref:Uncharacterized protein n=1 Tax=Quercus rubra TaxID=3512 RepID=A0AAN7J6I7_QUERU|nr:hypothetical protein RGQ29_009777 [Quercus rubra]
MVENLQTYSVVRSKKVAEVMEKVDRALFVPDGNAPYYDSPMPIGYNATISAPHMHATCLQLLEDNLQPGMHALDVGSGINEITIAIGVLALAFGSYLSWLRVSQLFHTVSQVVVGAVLGTIFSILWYLSWDVIVLKAFIFSFWVQAIVVLGAAGFCLGFLVHVVRYWLRDEDEISK